MPTQTGPITGPVQSTKRKLEVVTQESGTQPNELMEAQERRPEQPTKKLDLNSPLAATLSNTLCPVELPPLQPFWNKVTDTQSTIVHYHELQAREQMIETLLEDKFALTEMVQGLQARLSHETDKRAREKRLRHSLARFDILEQQTALESALEEKEKENAILRLEIAKLEQQLRDSNRMENSDDVFKIPKAPTHERERGTNLVEKLRKMRTQVQEMKALRHEVADIFFTHISDTSNALSSVPILEPHELEAAAMEPEGMECSVITETPRKKLRQSLLEFQRIEAGILLEPKPDPEDDLTNLQTQVRRMTADRDRLMAELKKVLESKPAEV